MKTIFATTLLLLSSVPALGQSDSPNREPQHYDYGWIGLLGLAGLRRPKNPDHDRLAASGVNVKTVKDLVRDRRLSRVPAPCDPSAKHWCEDGFVAEEGGAQTSAQGIRTGIRSAIENFLTNCALPSYGQQITASVATPRLVTCNVSLQSSSNLGSSGHVLIPWFVPVC